MDIISRRDAGLPPMPSSIGHRSLSRWAGIKVHHTGGAFSSWRAIYDWQVLNRPPSQRLADIGYSFGIANGRVTELRGWGHHPAHDHENSTLGVVFGGNFTGGLPPAADLAAFVQFCRLAREKTGKRLAITGHRDTWPRGDRRWSTCPGDRLHGHLPELRRRVDEEDDDMDAQDKLRVPQWIRDRWPQVGDAIEVGPALVSGYGHSRAASDGVQRVLAEQRAGQAAILAQLDGEDVAQAAADAARAAVRDEFAALTDAAVVAVRQAVPKANQATAEAALRAVLGSLDEDDES